MLASALQVQTGLWAECPSMIALEESVLQWTAPMISYPSSSSQGIITSGGSTTLLTAMICARIELGILMIKSIKHIVLD